ncbi:hypothetical protein BEP19_08950 [Ammoniphilus oxalaticus]|uniref:EamA domain-containing protein n=1 Tax=Ammoniphilus oxalaticus TaxID=66863 RepID=A0A419SKJ8_9BACL|nr:DMT family transporter [Ammoniphilus oxalaticus]RKD24502.1 hypothetical protein BEP19_08950 [Ammoniphilus oxalaticus]
MSRQKSIWIFSFGAACFGFTPIFSKLGFLAGCSLGQIIGSQMLLSTLILWMLTLLRKPDWRRLTKLAVVKLMASGTLSGLTGVFYYASLQYLPASLAIILLFQFVWIGIFYEWIFDRRVPTKLTFLSLILTLFGVVLAANMLGGEFKSLSVKGLVFGLISGFTYAGFIYVNGKVAPEVDPIMRTTFMISGSLIMAIVIFPSMFVTTEMIKSSVWLYSSGTALFGSIIPPLLFSISAPHLPSGISTILGSLELPVAVVMAKLIFAEPIGLLQWLGILLILFSISLDQLKTWFNGRNRAGPTRQIQ